MDENSPAARVERTLWTVWCYISEAVNRFFRPQPGEPGSSDPNSPGADGELPDCGLSQDDIVNSSEREGIDEEQPHAAVSLLSTSSATVVWTACTDDSKSEEEEATQLRKGNETEETEDEKRTREEGLDHEELLDAEEKTNQVEQEDTEIKKCYSCELSEEESTDIGSVGQTNETVSKVMEKSDEEGGGDEESKTPDDCQKVEEPTTETQITEDDVEEDLEDEEKLCKAEEGVDTGDVAPTFRMKEANICEGASQLSSETENTWEERRKQADSQLSVCEEVSENELIVPELETGGKNDEKMSGTATEEEEEEEEDHISNTAQKLAEDEEPETEKNNRTVQDGRQEENVLTESVSCSEVAEFTCKEEDVVVIVETTEADVATAETDLNKSCLDKDQVGNERPTIGVDNKASCGENVCTSVTVKPETAREAGRDFKNIPRRMSEGQATVSHERSTEASEETREGVPEHNNELESDENKTQGFLGGGNCGEIHNIPLPEEVEDEERARFINSGTGDDYLLEGGLLEETQDSTDRSHKTIDLTKEKLTESQISAQDIEEPQSGKETLESEFLFEEEVELLDSSMKTKFKPLGKELETYDETEKTTEELQDGDKAPEFGADGEPVKEAAGDGDERNKGVAVDKEVEFDEGTSNFLEAQAITEPRLCLDSEQSAHSNQTSEGTYNLEDTTDLRILQQKEIKLSDDNVEILHVDTKEGDSTADKMLDINQISTLQLAETTEELIQTQNDKVNALITESGVSLHPERHTVINQSPLTALQMQEINTDTEAAIEAEITEARNNLEMPAEETKQEGRYTSSSVTGHQDVIDEEILNLWMETAMSKDTDNDEEDQFEPQKDTTEHQFSGEHSPESEKQLLMEPRSVEPTAVSDTERLSEPGYLDQTQQLKPTTFLEDVHNMLVTASQSADSSEFSALDFESQAELIEETAVTAEPGRVTESCSDSGLSPPEEKQLNEGSERLLEEPDENPPETQAEIETRTAAWKETEEARVTSLIDVHFQDETRVEDEPVKDALFEEGFISTEPLSGGKKWIESEENQMSLDHRCSEETTESLLRLSRAEVSEKQTVTLEDQDEVDALLLDSRIQRSRISVKNPRVRPPTDPRSLINMPSADPTPSSHVPVKLPGVPLGGLGMGIKLPGLGGGFPVLKKTQRSTRGEDNQSIQSQEPEKKVEEESEGTKQDETQHKPKWMPPGHAGFGNPLMSELRTKLKKTPTE